jgi:purine-binding chemotaxis protein CheW
MTESSTLRLLLWRVGTVRCGAPVAQLRAVVPAPPMARIPGVPAAITGIGNVRGEVITLVDGRTLLSQPDHQPAEEAVLVQLGERTLGLGVDEVEDLVTVPESALQSLEGGEGPGRMVRLDGIGAIRLLDLEALLEPLFLQ